MKSTAVASGLLPRFAVSAAAAGVFLLFVLLRALWPSAYHAVLAFQGIPRTAAPFSDLSSVLQAIHCAQTGVDVYRPSACMDGGVYNYSPLALHAGFLGAAAAHPMLSGLLLDFAVLAGLALLPPPENRAEFWFRAFGAISSAGIFALERGNLDAGIFLVTLCAVALLQRGSLARLAAYALFCVIAAVKYYPAALLIFVLGEQGWRRLALVAILAGGGVVFLVLFGPGTLAAARIIPHAGPLGNVFGAINIPLGFSMLVSPEPGIRNYLMPDVAKLALAAFCLASLAFGLTNARHYRQALAGLDIVRAQNLIAGAAVVCTCFFIAQNGTYRGLFLLLLLPGLWAMAAQENSGRRLRWLRWLALALMWEELFRVTILRGGAVLFGRNAGHGFDILFWLARELAWWWLIAQLLAILFCYTKTALGQAAIPWRVAAATPGLQEPSA